MREAPPVTRVTVFSSSALRRESWHALLSDQPGIAVLGTVGGVSDLPAAPASSPPATVFVDEVPTGPDLVSQLRAAAPDRGLLFVVPSYDLPEILPLLRAGATGCVSVGDSVGDLARAIIAAGRGEIVLPPTVASRALAALARGETSGGEGDAALVEPLSEREDEVLRLLARGLTNKDTAQSLLLSVRTVEAHLRNIFGKLGVRSRTEAALWAVRHGYDPEAKRD